MQHFRSFSFKNLYKKIPKVRPNGQIKSDWSKDNYFRIVLNLKHELPAIYCFWHYPHSLHNFVKQKTLDFLILKCFEVIPIFSEEPNLIPNFWALLSKNKDIPYRISDIRKFTVAKSCFKLSSPEEKSFKINTYRTDDSWLNCWKT